MHALFALFTLDPLFNFREKIIHLYVMFDKKLNLIKGNVKLVQ